ncbi:uncharacterized protein LOC109724903 [Ananas comosus]|uniref:Uncharacterized protein LOC109724903 n=2 Tax=Ananas comosus TaxID=4615 RepID=A0A6P5GNM1_ANACO|nr:uncharacterized protein LOC109724903 [Ananas comosus]XP_020109472.1 uncharacterized protein LOC109724903 [Ananas comosus]XP_020109473.1 uncharacterized protein LOC109724903 [Ananas comosus]XP_020109474.1 uncharacterized protein LOC109724903 [Ananas comosus]CAD1831992.1 unnamed protein product [Ananas comosus var. bracteatus]
MASNSSHKRAFDSTSSKLEDIKLNNSWDDVICPICLDFPHNGILLLCSSYKKGCRPFMCDTDQNHSNCLDRFKTVHGFRAAAKVSADQSEAISEGIQVISSNPENCPTCPLCRGEVTGWVVVDEARHYLNMKRRCCEEKRCSYVGNYMELEQHAKNEHPHARPSEIDPAQQLDWDNFQQSSEIIDVLSTIHSEVPNGVVLGDYVIEYGDDSHDEFDDFPGDDGNWWTSCILYHVFDNFRASRNRRRSAVSERRRRRHMSSYDGSVDGRGSVSPMDVLEYNLDESDDEFGGAATGGGVALRSESQRSYRRRRSRFQDP